MLITKIRLAECRIALPQVLKLGATEIKTRDYLVMRIDTDSGVSGEAIGYVRGTPLLAATEMLARLAVGRDPLMRAKLIAFLNSRSVPGRAAFTRAISLFDIACWDILAKASQQPLYRLLGGLRSSISATAVAGYYMNTRTLTDIANEVSGLMESGFSRAKIMLKGDDPAFDFQYLDAVTERAPGKVAADTHWSWSTLTDAKRFCKRIDEYDLEFLEDPFPAAEWPLAVELQRDISTPIAIGEDVHGARTLRDIAMGVGLLRVDATTCGGITGAVEAIQHAAAAGKNVFPHVFFPLHIQLACAFENVESVEVISTESGADPLEQLLVDMPAFAHGAIKPSEDPGVGIKINWLAVERIASIKSEC
jgi:L-alanine-DL-glutamate epimerase-like enolase superfamily enzyme